MRCLLIFPYNERKIRMSLSLGYLAAVLEKDGHEVEIADFNKDPEDLVFEKIAKGRYALVGLTGLSTTYREITRLIKIFRSYPNCPSLVVGGPMISSQMELMGKHLDADFLCYGEGEQTILQLCEHLEGKRNIQDVKGVIVRTKDGLTHINPPQPLVQNLDSIPMPAWHLFDMDLYKRQPPGSNWQYYASIIGSRGCPFKCTFCYRNFDGSFRLRSMDNVLSEISFLIDKYDIDHFLFSDELFLGSKERILEFGKQVKKRKLKFDFKVSLHVSCISKETVQALKDAGCVLVCVGVEHASDKMLKIMKKNATKERNRKALKTLKDAGLPVSCSTIFGMPGETTETMKETEDFYHDLQMAASIHIAQPLPGTWFYDYAVEKGHIKDEIEYLMNLPEGTHKMAVNCSEVSDQELQETVARVSRETWALYRKYNYMSKMDQAFHFIKMGKYRTLLRGVVHKIKKTFKGKSPSSDGHLFHSRTPSISAE